MTARRLRTAAAILIELAGLASIAYGTFLLATWLGCVVAGMIAVGVAIYLSPAGE